MLRLTPKGEQAAAHYRRTNAALEEDWAGRFGASTVAELRQSALALIEQRGGGRRKLSEGLAPAPDGWRATRPYLAQTQAMLADPVAGLPHHPIVTHRGGWPDGS